MRESRVAKRKRVRLYIINYFLPYWEMIRRYIYMNSCIYACTEYEAQYVSQHLPYIELEYTQ